MKFTKIKIDKAGKVELSYREENEKTGCITDHNITCNDAPRPEMLNTMNNLAVYVCQIAELPVKQVDRITMRGVSISYSSKTQNIGVILTALRELEKSDSPMLINTPLKYDASENENAVLPKGCMGALDELIREAEKYAKGERLQLSLALMEDAA